MRICDVCNKKMEQGYYVNDSEYYCSENCLCKVYTLKEYGDLFDDDLAYWTQWGGTT